MRCVFVECRRIDQLFDFFVGACVFKADFVYKMNTSCMWQILLLLLYWDK